MRERRLRDRGKIVFDYRDLIDGRKQEGKTLIKMKKGPITYTSTAGTKFFRDHPYSWVPTEEAQHLLGFKEENFVYFVPATIEEVEDYYAD
jgi:hypothetical protein